MTGNGREAEARSVVGQEMERRRIKREVELALKRTAALREAVRRIEEHFETLHRGG